MSITPTTPREGPPRGAPLTEQEPWTSYAEAKARHAAATDELLEAVADALGLEGLLLERTVLLRDLHRRVREIAQRYPVVLRLEVVREFKAGIR